MSDKNLSRGLLILDLLFAALDRVEGLKALFQKGRDEGWTDEQWDAEIERLRAEDDVAAAELDRLIAAKRAETPPPGGI